jgi:hypothetical protein
MTRRATIHRHLFRAVPAAAGAAALVLLGLSGCFNTQQVLRPQQADETERDRYGVKTCGALCDVGSAEPRPVGGVGLVTGLDGTGGDSPRDENRTALEKYLRQLHPDAEVGKLLGRGDTALVIVSGTIPPGARAGDRFDVEVTLPAGSQATSLRGGRLERCVLYTYEYGRSPQGTVGTLQGHPLARAEGPLQLSLGKSEGDDEAGRETHAHVWQGGWAKVDNPMSLILTSDSRFTSVSCELAARINDTFPSGGGAGAKVADASGKDGVLLHVPPAYKLNLPHFLRVVRLVPTRAGAEASTGERGQPKSYRQRLAEDLLDPARTVTAALRLEALGEKGVPALMPGLQSRHPLVRFCSAESLAYLGHAAGAQALGEAVERQPLLRSYALAALASLDENVTRTTLEHLMEAGVAHEIRYGAFRALRELAPDEPLTRGESLPPGEPLNAAFSLHRVAGGSPPLVHLCTAKRAEVVLFGSGPALVPPFAFEANGYTVTATHEGDDHCVISCVPRGAAKPVRAKSSLAVADVLRLLARMDATYPDVVGLLIEAANCQCLNCPVALNALPQVAEVEELAAAGKGGDALLDLGGQDLGATPTLYERGRAPRSQRTREIDSRRTPRAGDAAPPAPGGTD